MNGRVVATAAVGVAVGVVMVLLGMEPRLMLVGMIVVAAAATSFLLADLGEEVASLDWYGHDVGDTTTVALDFRVQHLRGSLHRSMSRRRSAAAMLGDDDTTDQVVSALVQVIDDTLLAEHGIDRSADPARAAGVLGPDLTRFVDRTGGPGPLSRRRLAHIVDLIEQLHDRAPAAAAGPEPDAVTS